ncbi:uncharacterized protein LOC104583679 [Brachypodium distachyon]|uniref:Uncharacterized protein n=1 Tax=Brachypodium distachyon TaxID=15368 RepID=A0A2K2D077_BRADI|nr:uncharacterized protein LOC104583679 [Brachypodium distachyon]PNT67675.1 hypothetical protein BRADI_3g30386v3 [Brachypodium distachyon]|eukprot:XP_010234892.3 uncharacterized protein LOC104583679 [Brachypodium distachyon]
MPCLRGCPARAGVRRTALAQPQPSPRQSPLIRTSSSLQNPLQSHAPAWHATVVSFQLTALLRPIYTHTQPHGHTHTHSTLPCSSHPQLTQVRSSHTNRENRVVFLQLIAAAMARRGFLCSPRVLVLLLLLVLGDAAAMAMARQLLGGVAQTPWPAGAPAAEGPAGDVARPRRHEDRSIAGAEVILAGFAAAVVAAIFCYIRVTRKKSSGSHGATLGTAPEKV